MNLAEMQYWHAKLNYMFFDGQLEPAIIQQKEKIEDDDGIEARFIDCTDPFIIVFYNDPEDREEGLELYTITVLLHEMIHQYCKENEIEDTDEYGVHLEEFREEAARHGLTQNGYRLTDEAKEKIEKELEDYRRLTHIERL